MTVSIERIRRIKKIYAHDHCADGTSAAAIVCMAMWLLGKKKGEDYEVELIQYKTKKLAELVPEPDCLFVDITPQPGKHQDWLPFDPIVLDHHATVENVVRDLGGEFGSTTESGASMAFKHVLGPVLRLPVEELVPKDCPVAGLPAVAKTLRERPEDVRAKWQVFSELCAIRDTWQEDSPSWEAAQALARGIYLQSPWRIINQAARGGNMAGLESPWWHFFQGHELLKKDLRKAFITAKTAYRFEAAGVRCAVMNCTENIVSEACHELLKDGVDLACSFFTKFEEGEYSWVMSLRSRHGNVEAKKIAEALGGGGHPRAAGFTLKSALDMSVQRLVALISERVSAEVCRSVLDS